MYPLALDRLLARRPNAPRLKVSILSHHTSAEDADRIAAAAKVEALVLNHFVPSDDPAVTPAISLEATRSHFGGQVVLGRSLLSLPQ